MTTTDSRGELDVRVPDGPLRLASISARGFHPWMPEWGHSPFLIRVAAGSCVSGLVFFLTPRVTYTCEVVAPDGAPVAGANVTVHARHLPPAPPLVTDQNGEVQLEAPDDAVVVARHPAFEPGRAELGLAAGITRRLTVRLGHPRDAGVASRTLTGRVLDSADAGLAGALVTVAVESSSDAGEHLEAIEQSTESDVDGRFTFVVEDAEAWTLTAEQEGLVPASQTTHGEPVELRLAGGGAIRGTVKDSTGQPVASFAVTLVRRIGAFDIGTPRVASFIDPSGSFELRGVAPDVHVVTAIAAGLAASEPSVVEVPAGGVKNVELVVRRGGALTGKVVSRDGGAPLDGARVALEGGGDSSTVVPVTAETRTSADGVFTLTGIPPGLRSVMVAASNHHARLLPPTQFREAETVGPVTVDLGPVRPGEQPQIELVGIGAVLKAEGDALVIRETVPGGGAAEAGLVPGDAIVSIEGTPAAQLGFAGGIERIRGPENTFVQLRVRRVDGATVDLSVPRRRVQR